MISPSESVAPFYDGWRFAQERLVERIGELSSKQLQLRAAPHLWPIWAIAAHAAGVRPYWLCHIDHKIRYTDGGLTVQENGRCLCPKHNRDRENDPNQRPPPDQDE